MSFDPYYQWLGIPPQEQPPNHYRLLGLVLLEANPDVISAAADRQMTHLRAMQSGPHAAQSQKLLNEVAAARVCLLTPTQKTAYDQALLAAYQQVAMAGPLVPARSTPEAAPVDSPASIIVTDGPSSASSAVKARRKAEPTAAARVMEVVKIAFGGIAGIAIAVLLLWIGFKKDPLRLFGGKEKPVAKNGDSPATSPPSTSGRNANQGGATVAPTPPASTGPPATAPNPGNTAGAPPGVFLGPPPGFPGPPPGFPGPNFPPGVFPGGPPPGPGGGASGTPPGTPAANNNPPRPGSIEELRQKRRDQRTNPPNKNTSPSNPKPTTPNPSNPSTTPDPFNPPSTPSNPTPSDPPPPAVAARQPVPADSDLTGPRGTLRDLYKPKFDAINERGGSRKFDELAELASELLAVAEDEPDQAARYATLELASKIAVSSGSVDAVLQVSQSWAAKFEGDAFAQQVDLLQQVANKLVEGTGDAAARNDRLQRWLTRVANLAERADSEKRDEEAVRLFQLVAEQAEKSADVALPPGLQAKLQAVQRRGEKRIRAQQLLTELASRPDDAALNQELGEYYCFDIDDWMTGLPYLTRGEEVRLKEAASKEIAGASTAEAQELLGDQWWELAQAATPEQRSRYLNRAAHWYRRSRPNAKGLSRAKLDERLAELDRSAPSPSEPDAPPPPGAPRGVAAETALISLDMSKDVTIHKIPLPKNADPNRLIFEITKVEAPATSQFRNSRQTASLGAPLVVEFAEAKNVWIEATAIRSGAEEIAIRISPRFKFAANQEFPFTVTYLDEQSGSIDQRLVKAQRDASRASETVDAAKRIANDSSVPQQQRINAAAIVKAKSGLMQQSLVKVNELTAIKRVLPAAIDFAKQLDGKVKFQIAILVPAS